MMMGLLVNLLNCWIFVFVFYSPFQAPGQLSEIHEVNVLVARVQGRLGVLTPQMNST